ncbi:TIGR03086 family metal-binding protein [Actinomadura sp. DC4]|uniref:TIGR03086 family metal-binding protein n=1 Tax=Actinomadura sp. DC4 TaxID=3055069 RepID=UPI0025B08E41|nr:TIGR03086 family metal-binding protein [Actinomadura sp. DC4]MDN3351389.1 TIGR03086 family metal-binding protein [Actinomadura sp. DC4]
MDIQELHRRAIEHAVETVARVPADRLAAPTPCLDWTVRGLLRHMISLNEGFTAAAYGGGADLNVWRNGRIGADHRASFAESAKKAAEAFGEDGVLDRAFDLPEVRRGEAFPGTVAIGFHLVDNIVHSWDIAAAVGLPWEPADDLVAAALTIALRVPDLPETRGPGLAFEPGLDVPEETPDRERLLAVLGRSPAWTPPVQASRRH